ncbi:MAG: YggT family protein [Alphaproteobacteria bacterium]|jgi:YggT family protein|nr:YggT family protein [Alphaproteobacteria bacterium]
MIGALAFIVDSVATLLIWIIIINVVLSWLIGFNIINPYNPFVRAVHTFCYRVTEPLLAPIRRMLPDLGGIDISPIILLIAIGAARILLLNLLAGQLF